MGKLDGKVAVITAATSGMALATAKLFVPIIVIGLLGVGLTEFVMWLERRLSRWRTLERERF